MQVRTLGTPSTFIKQLGQLPDTHMRPRGRWYLKLRVKVRTPAAYRAEATVSPSTPSTRFPLKVKATRFEGEVTCDGLGGRRLAFTGALYACGAEG